MHDDPQDNWSDDPDDDAWDGDGDWDDESENVVDCPQCGAEVYDDSPRCPVCGEWITANTGVFAGRSIWWIVLGILGIFATTFALLLG